MAWHSIATKLLPTFHVRNNVKEIHFHMFKQCICIHLNTSEYILNIDSDWYSQGLFHLRWTPALQMISRKVTMPEITYPVLNFNGATRSFGHTYKVSAYKWFLQ